ncbi:hypothetical protein [Desemzia sp. FAM 23991]|uniref:hypothetical protein n=1 Tax=unclassified Desemzia TaxID=2685243 RepID=UPI0038876DA3
MFNKLYILLISLFILSACGTDGSPSEVSVEESQKEEIVVDEREANYDLGSYQSIFEMDAETFQQYWNSVADNDEKIDTFSKSNKWIDYRYDAMTTSKVNISIIEDADTHINRYAVVIGSTSSDDVYDISEKLILLTDNTLSMSEKDEIFELLGFSNREIEDMESATVTKNGLTYQADFEYLDGVPILQFEIE